MIDDVLDSDFTYQLMNDAKDEIETMQDWAILKTYDDYTVSSGYSYTSALDSLPSDFGQDIRVIETTGYTEYEKVAFDDLQLQQNISFGYFLDLENDNLHLTGSNHTAKTVRFYYTKTSTDIAAATEWVFPSRFHSIIALKMAELYFATDAGEKSRSWDDRWAMQFERQLNRMYAWNDRLLSRNIRTRGVKDNPKGIMY